MMAPMRQDEGMLMEGPQGAEGETPGATGPDYTIERRLIAAVTDLSTPPAGLTDSKMLTARRRERIAEELRGWVSAYAFGAASPEEIDEAGMTEALRRAAVRALEALPDRPDAIILDGKHDYLGGGRTRPGRTEVKADLRSVTVAAASVLAKVHRDA